MSVDDYLESLDEPRKSAMQRLRKLIKENAPEMDEKLWDYQGTMIIWGTYEYESKSGLKGDWFTLGLASRKNYISLYTMAVIDGKYLAETRAPEFANSKSGRSCINIKDPSKITDQQIKNLVLETKANFKP